MPLIPDPKKKVEAYGVERCCRAESCPGWYWVVSTSYFVATYDTREAAEQHAGALNSGRFPP